MLARALLLLPLLALAQPLSRQLPRPGALSPFLLLLTNAPHALCQQRKPTPTSSLTTTTTAPSAHTTKKTTTADEATSAGPAATAPTPGPTATAPAHTRPPPPAATAAPEPAPDPQPPTYCTTATFGSPKVGYALRLPTQAIPPNVFYDEVHIAQECLEGTSQTATVATLCDGAARARVRLAGARRVRVERGGAARARALLHVTLYCLPDAAAAY